MIDPITNKDGYNSFSTDADWSGELNEINHVWFHLTFKNKLYTDEKHD